MCFQCLPWSPLFVQACQCEISPLVKGIKFARKPLSPALGIGMIRGRKWQRIILCMHPANERWSYIVTLFLIGWAHIQNDPWNWKIFERDTMIFLYSGINNRDTGDLRRHHAHYDVTVMVHDVSRLWLLLWQPSNSPINEIGAPCIETTEYQ